METNASLTEVVWYGDGGGEGGRGREVRGRGGVGGVVGARACAG